MSTYHNGNEIKNFVLVHFSDPTLRHKVVQSDRQVDRQAFKRAGRCRLDRPVSSSKHCFTTLSRASLQVQPASLHCKRTAQTESHADSANRRRQLNCHEKNMEGNFSMSELDSQNSSSFLALAPVTYSVSVVRRTVRFCQDTPRGLHNRCKGIKIHLIRSS